MGVRNGKLLATLALAIVAGSGCVATKGDIRSLQQEMAAMQERQEEALQDLYRQNRLLLDSIRTTMALTVDARGSTTNQLRQFNETVARTNELLAQIMSAQTRIEQRVTALEQRPVAAAPSAADGDVEQYYTLGIEKLQERSYSTARSAFEALITQFPDHPRAADAQYQIGETYVAEEEWSEAYEAFEQVAERWESSPRAPAALFRAGVVAQDRRDNTRARRYFTAVREQYPDTDEARQAQSRLSRLR